jgi:hypothetical protein
MRLLVCIGIFAQVALARFPWRFALALSVVPPCLLGLLVITFRTVNQDVVYPRVRVNDTPISGLGKLDAREVVAKATSRRLQEEITLRAGDLLWRRTLQSLGLGASDWTVTVTVDEAWKIGHRTTWQDWWADLVVLLRVGVVVPTTLTLDRERARDVIGSFRSSVERDPVNAEIVLVEAGDGYEVHLTPATAGVRVDIEATIDTVRAAATKSGQIRMATIVDIATVVTQATVSTEALRASTAAATALLDDPIELVDPDDTRRRFVLDAPTAHAMLQLGRSEAGVLTTARLDPKALRAWVTEVAKSITRAPTNPRVALESGKLVIDPGVPGRRVDIEATAQRIEASLTSTSHSVTFVVAPDAPWVPVSAVEEARAQVEAATRDPIVLVIPVAGATVERRVATEAVLAWLALPETEIVPRDTSTLAPPNRPRLTWKVDGAALGDYVTRSVAPLVAKNAVDPRVVTIARAVPAEAPTPLVSDGPGDFTATPTPRTTVDMSKRTASGTQTPSNGARTAIAAGATFAAPIITPSLGATLTVAPTALMKPTATTIGATLSLPSSPTTTPTVGPITYAFEAIVVPGRAGRAVDVEALARAVDARLHDDLTPLAGILVLPPTATSAATSFGGVGGATPTARPASVFTASRTPPPTHTATVTATPTSSSVPRTLVSPTVGVSPLANEGATGAPTATRDRRFLIQTFEVSPNVDAANVARMARTANVLIGAPVAVEWSNGEWWVETNDLVDLLRFGPFGSDVDAYLGRDGLLAIADRIGREATRLNDAPRDAAGAVIPVDVPQTAAAIWAAANRTGSDRRAEVAWSEDDPTPVPGVTTPVTGPPTATRTPIRNPVGRYEPTPSPTPTI